MENLCQLTYTVNKTLYKNPLQDASGKTFRIESPTIFKLNFCTPKEMAIITGIFTGLELVHNVTFYPPGYCKGQKQPAYDIEINLGYGGTEFACNLLEFGCSFGKMQFEGEVFNLSHSGGTGGDYCQQWCISNKPITFAKLVQNKFIAVRN